MSDENSNESPGGLRRSGRIVAAASNDQPDSSDAAASNSSFGEREMRRLRLKNNVGLDGFMDNFDPDTSEREKRKQMKKNNASQAGGRHKNALYDSKGLLASSQRDLCDCMSASCPGCHFPCPRCRSHGCGQECRQNRRWQYETVELDGVAGSARKNPNLVSGGIGRDIPDKA